MVGNYGMAWGFVFSNGNAVFREIVHSAPPAAGDLGQHDGATTVSVVFKRIPTRRNRGED
jgi:hypothetical protein